MASASPVASPASDQKLWSTLHGRVDVLLDSRRRKLPSDVAESEAGKRLREDSLLLIRGFDSVSSSLSQLTDILDVAAQGVRELAKPSLTEVLKSGSQIIEADEEVEPKSKRQCAATESTENLEVDVDTEAGKESSQETPEEEKQKDGNDDDDKKTILDISKDGKLEKAKKLAISMATKASSLARELKTIKSELCFMQDRCALLEEENKRLRDGFEEGLRPEEDDLVRLQLETLLAEKSRLANENATLRRENQCLHQLVEYHQLASQDLSESYEQAIQGMCLDFSPYAKSNSDIDEENGCAGEAEAPCTPRTANCGFSSLQECSEEEKLKTYLCSQKN